MEMVVSAGAAGSAGWKAEAALTRPNIVLIPTLPGLWAMLSAAWATVAGAVPGVAEEAAFALTVVHAKLVELLVLTQAERMSASVLIVINGTVPLPPGVVARVA